MRIEGRALVHVLELMSDKPPARIAALMRVAPAFGCREVAALDARNRLAAVERLVVR